MSIHLINASPPPSLPSSSIAEDENCILWGPMTRAQAAAHGSHAPCASVLLRPKDAEDLRRVRDSVRQLIPDVLIPRHDDSPASLAARLASCSFLDDISPIVQLPLRKHKRCGPGKLQLNSSTFAQPRRTSFGVPCEVGGRQCLPMYPMNHHYFSFCRVMPATVCELARVVWGLASPFLSPSCPTQPPNHCQLLWYYTLFESRMGQHSDNFVASDLLNYWQSGIDPTSGPEQYAQQRGSDVLIWTEGTSPMLLTLSFPRSKMVAGIIRI